MTNLRKFKLYIYIYTIFSLISCKTEREPFDCEAYHRPNLAISCTNEESPDFCLIEILSYYKCKEENSKKLFNKFEF